MNWHLVALIIYACWEVLLCKLGHHKKTILYWTVSTLAIAVVVVAFKISERRRNKNGNDSENPER